MATGTGGLRPVKVGANLIKRVTKSRDIADHVQCMLWGRAAARCEFKGCNRQLSRSSVTQEAINAAQKAHIYAFSSSGPRGNKGIAKKKLNELDNLMLVCHECHQKIDRDKAGKRYSVMMLQQWKAAHERRVKLVTGINPNLSSHVVHYSANIGDHGALLAPDQTMPAMFPHRYPAEAEPIELGLGNSAARDCDAEFWAFEEQQLRRRFAERITARVSGGSVRHLSVFALAPQPLLILLGTLLADIVPTDTYAYHRRPKGWHWQKTAPDLGFTVTPPTSAGGVPAVVFSLSGKVADERVRSVLPADTSVWRLDMPDPHNDCLKSRDQLARFAEVTRSVLDRVYAEHGGATVHVFPAMPAAMAVEFGRLRMPKVDPPWQLYDQVKKRDGFVAALKL